MVNTTTKTFNTAHGRILCIADIRGRLSAINDLARQTNAVAVIHTGDFGFFESNSLDRINDRTLRHLTMYSPLVASAQRTHLLAQQQPLRSNLDISLLTEFPTLLSGNLRLSVPVYTVWGACEDVLILEKFRTGAYDIPNLHIIDEATTHLLDLGGVKLRLLGLGGAVVPHKMFDNGDGNATIAGGQGTMWTTALQVGELVDTAQRSHDPSETRVLVTHASPGREGIIAQLALVCKADLTVSAGLHFRYSTSWNEFSVQADYEGFRRKLVLGKEMFDKVWESVKVQVDQVVDENQKVLLDKALSVVERIPPPMGTAPSGLNPAKEAMAVQDEPAWKNCWNWNLCDAAYGNLVLDVREGRVSAELKSQGFNYAYRRSATVPATPTSANPTNLNAKSPGPPPAKSPAPPAPAPALASASASRSPAPPSSTGAGFQSNSNPNPNPNSNAKPNAGSSASLGPNKFSAPPSKSGTPAPGAGAASKGGPSSNLNPNAPPSGSAVTAAAAKGGGGPGLTDRALPPHLAAQGGAQGGSNTTSGRGTPSSVSVSVSDAKDKDKDAGKEGSVKDKDGSAKEKDGKDKDKDKDAGKEKEKEKDADKDKDKEKEREAAKAEKAERDKQKKKEKKERERERKEKEKERAATAGTPTSTTTTSAPPNTTTNPNANANAEDIKSPASATGTLNSAGGAGSTGARTPRGTKPARNPWTIFLRSGVSTTEADLRGFFAEGVGAGGGGGGVTRVHFPSSTGAGRAQKLAYVEFGDEESMRRGLERSGSGQKLNNAIPEIKQATDKETREREQRDRAASRASVSSSLNSPVVQTQTAADAQSQSPASQTPTNPNQNQSHQNQNQHQQNHPHPNPHPERNSSFRGRGRGGGGFASRGLAAAGLTRGGAGPQGGQGQGQGRGGAPGA